MKNKIINLLKDYINDLYEQMQVCKGSKQYYQEKIKEIDDAIKSLL